LPKRAFDSVNWRSLNESFQGLAERRLIFRMDSVHEGHRVSVEALDGAAPNLLISAVCEQKLREIGVGERKNYGPVVRNVAEIFAIVQFRGLPIRLLME